MPGPGCADTRTGSDRHGPLIDALGLAVACDNGLTLSVALFVLSAALHPVLLEMRTAFAMAES